MRRRNITAPTLKTITLNLKSGTANDRRDEAPYVETAHVLRLPEGAIELRHASVKAEDKTTVQIDFDATDLKSGKKPRLCLKIWNLEWAEIA